MNKFGILKSKILQKFTDAYASGNRSEIKETLKLIKENKEFREMYLFYEELENKYIDNKEDAKLFIEEISPILKEKSKSISKFCKNLDKKIGDVTITENELYSNIDILCENDTLKNAHKKIIGKQKLVDYLTTKKEEKELTNLVFTENENLLHTVLTNNFNVLYGNTLNEEQKEELKKILSITNEELQSNFQTLKEEVSEKMNKMIVEEKNDEIKEKINQALTEMSTMDGTKFNYYKLLQLKNGL